MRTSVTIIGAGQAGLAMSRCLTDRSIDHIVLERGEVANSWRTERWDSLRLLTPNWMTRLPGGHRYTGDDPDGYMTAGELVDLLDRYSSSFDAPVRTGTEVQVVTSLDLGFRVETNEGEVDSKAVIIATGASSTPRIPPLATELPARIQQVTPVQYRNPAGVGDSVLVVGASASGAQIADELARAGRDVALAVGEHVRVPRTYRGLDIHWWMETIGLLDERFDEIDDIERARRLPSLQLIGSPQRRTLDLNALQHVGVELVGRLAGIAGSTAQFSGSFANHCAAADLKLGRLLDRIDDHVTTHGLDCEVNAADRPTPTNVPRARTTLDLTAVDTIIWATGYRPNHPTLEPELLDRKGAIRHDGGIMTQPGMYILGLPFMRRRKSSFLDGVGADAHDLTQHVAHHLGALAAGRA